MSDKKNMYKKSRYAGKKRKAWNKTRQSEAVVQRCSVKQCSWSFLKIHRKAPVPESLF